MTPPVLEFSGISKDYHGLRPLRIERLVVGAGERIAIARIRSGVGRGVRQPRHRRHFARCRRGARVRTSDCRHRRQRRLARDRRSLRHRERARRAARPAHPRPESGDAVHAGRRAAVRRSAGRGPKRSRPRSVSRPNPGRVLSRILEPEGDCSYVWAARWRSIPRFSCSNTRAPDSTGQRPSISLPISVRLPDAVASPWWS